MSRSKLGPTLSLSQFLLRQQVLKQFRTFIRTARKLPDQAQTSAVIDMVRQDFKTYKTIPVKDEDKIKSMLSYGERMLKELKQSAELSEA